MKRIFLIALLITLAYSKLSAQQDDFKYWQEGNLSWNDFKGNTSSAGLDSELKYYLTYSVEKQKVTDTNLFRIVAHCYIDRNRSWAKEFMRTEQFLKYFQLVFDILELNRRTVQNNLDKLDGVYQADAELHAGMSRCEYMLDKFRQESHYGTDSLAVNHWQQKIQSELSQMPVIPIPRFTKKDFGYGMHAGFGKGFNSGSFGNYFPSTLNFMFGFDLAYKDVTLFICATLAGTKAGKDYQGGIQVVKDEHVGVAILDCSFGYPLINSAKFKLSPFAGGGLIEYSKHAEAGTTHIQSLIKPAFLFGLNTDYKIRKALSLIPETFLNTREYTEISIRARLYIARANMAPDLQGYSINLTLGLGMTGNIIRLKD